MKNKENKSALKSVYDWVETFIFALAAVVLIFTFCFKFVMVSGTSMQQTFQNADRLLITAMGYTPKNGDVVVVDVSHNLEAMGHQSTGPYIKRVIATEGQEVYIDSENWQVYVDNKPIDEPYVYNCDGMPMIKGYMNYPLTVPPGHVFVMGDNRNGSSDSRMIGPIDQRYILGKAFVRLIPNFTLIK